MPRAKTSPRKFAAKAVRTPAAGKKQRQHSGLKHVAWESVKFEELNPLLGRQLMVGQQVMLARIFLKKGAVVPLHSHHHEQLSYVVEGDLVFLIGGRKIQVRAGEVLAIPPHLPHRVEALADSLSLDIFNPPREDWLNGSDQYLRGPSK
jgi:quercetin dioxygenase-like cupin family protein